MNKTIYFYIKPFLIIAGLCFGMCCIFSMPKTAEHVMKYIGVTATATSILAWFYIKWLWFYCPWETLPRFAKKYNGKLFYQFNGGGQKDIEIFIKQTLLSVNIKIKTNEIISNSIISNLVEENDCWLIYYTYITNPQAEYSAKNPIQRGTARLEIDKPELKIKDLVFRNKSIIKSLHGNYWTSRQTIGDLLFKYEEDI